MFAAQHLSKFECEPVTLMSHLHDQAEQENASCRVNMMHHLKWVLGAPWTLMAEPKMQRWLSTVYPDAAPSLRTGGCVKLAVQG